MTESEILINCNKLKELDTSGSHFVEKIDSLSTPSINDIETTKKLKMTGKKSIISNNKLNTSNLLLKNDKYGQSSSKLSSISPRSSKKRKREGYKSRLLQSGDDSEESNDDKQDFEPSNSGTVDPSARKKRSRRRKNRKYKPYNKLSWQERREQEDRETRRANRIRAQRFANGQPVAPYNTTQFLMEDHNDLKDIDVNQPPPHNPPLFPRQRGQRARDSSFSLESEEDFYYSSPEDEKEFLTKEFSTVYEDLHAEQLSAQPKTKLVQDVLNLEKKVDLLEKELNDVKSNKSKLSSSDEDQSMKDERDVLFKNEITKLSEENNRLRAENECLRRRCFGDEENHSTSSIDSESDSTASSSGSCSSSGSDNKVPLSSGNDGKIKTPVKEDKDEDMSTNEKVESTHV